MSSIPEVPNEHSYIAIRSHHMNKKYSKAQEKYFMDRCNDARRRYKANSSSWSSDPIEISWWKTIPERWAWLISEGISFLTLDELKKVVKKDGVSTFEQYHKVRKNRPEWPCNPDKFYKNQWVSWPDLFGRRKPEHLSFPKLKKAVKQAGVITQKQYRKTRKKNHPEWPSDPDKFYSEWVSWHDLFGRKVNK